MALTDRQKKHLRGLGHRLRPVVMIGQGGISDALVAELRAALERHELVKVKLASGDRQAREAAVLALCEQGRAELVQRVGNVALLFRRNRKKPVVRFAEADAAARSDQT